MRSVINEGRDQLGSWSTVWGSWSTVWGSWSIKFL